MEKDQEITRTGRIVRKARLAAAASGAAVLAGFASTAVVYGDDGDVAWLPWWV
jgi:tRNA splicing endonuclease